MNASLDPRLERSANPIVKAYDVAHVAFSRPDVEKMARFLIDFGLREGPAIAEGRSFLAVGGYGPCYLVTRGPAAFSGLALVVRSSAELECVARLPGASAPEPAEAWPAGMQVRLHDPPGNEVRVLWGPEPAPQRPRPPLVHNLDGIHHRLNAEQRPKRAAATVMRLGHVVLNVVEFFRCTRWYIDTFGLIPTDIQTIGDGDPALAFLRCDRGDEPADHHSVVIAQNVVDGFSHAAFECIDVDDVAMGQEWLLERGWKHAWGVGRHLLGSQIFDYWRDPWGDKVEHFVDSDMYTAGHPTASTPLTAGGLYQWGPPVPADFEKPRMTPRLIWRAYRNVRNSKELSFARVRQLMKAIEEPSRPWHRK